MQKLPPLLDILFQETKGYVLYRGHNAHKGDDVQALLELSLPSSIKFLPIPPRDNLFLDLRDLLPSILSKNQDTEISENPKVDSLILEMIFQKCKTGEKTPQEILKQFKQKYQTLYNTIVKKAICEYPLQKIAHIPYDAPILIVGSPEYFHGYDEETSDLKRLLNDVGYPNRYHFLKDGEKTIGIRDRKSGYVYYHTQQNEKEDIGFLFLGWKEKRQPVMVITGLSPLGVFAATKLLIQRRYEFEELREKLNDRSDLPCIDIGFRCQSISLLEERPFPLIYPVDKLKIEIFNLNPSDMMGFTWNKKAYSYFMPLLQKKIRQMSWNLRVAIKFI